MLMLNPQVPPCTPASNAESPAPPPAIAERSTSNGGTAGTVAAAAAAGDSKGEMQLGKRQSTATSMTTESSSASEMLCDSLLAGWEPEREAAEFGGSAVVENGDESGRVASHVGKAPMPFSRIATNLDELHKVMICLEILKLKNVYLRHHKIHISVAVRH